MGLFKSASNAGRIRPDKLSRSNIRGKISGPIPIHEEFPAQHAGPGTAQEEGPPMQSDPATAQRDSAVASTNTAQNAAREAKTNSFAQSRPSQASTGSSPARLRTTRSSLPRRSTVAEPADSASASLKKSAFKVTIGRLFGKRNQKQGNYGVSDSVANRESSNDHHRSGLSAANRGPANPEADHKRSASLPITEFNKALRSHSVGPEDYMAIHSVRNSLQADQRRRAAAASGIPASPPLPDESVDMLGLSPRPASHHDNPDSIGCAVSVDIVASHRRSRSLPHIQDIADGHIRKRSEEIRFWRESYNPRLLSPDLSVFNREDHETTGTVETAETIGTTETPDTTESAELTTSTHEEMPPVNTAPQPLHFEPIGTMKSTPATSLEERIATLEVRNHKLESLVSQLFQAVPGVESYTSGTDHPGSIVPTAPPTPSTAMGSAAAGPSAAHGAGPPLSSYSISEHSNEFSEDGKTYIGSAHPSTRETTRPISTVTIRGASSLPGLPREEPFTADQYIALKALLDVERAERLALEARIAKLTRMVDTFSRTTHKPGNNASPGAYTATPAFKHDGDEEFACAGIDHNLDAVETLEPTQPFQDYERTQNGGNAEHGKGLAGTLSLGQLALGKSIHPQQQTAGVDL
ncbi:hypothetical protein F4861DRAFT_531 [Xylaria intraflava]|nr:hypothetical protein F4861DRAFT_531 [Xylaria intraflava]